MSRFILIFVLLFVAELLLLIKIGSAIGALQCIALMFLAMVIGAVLVTLRARQLMQEMQHSHQVNIKLLWLPLAGFLFIFPGFITDVLAVLILLPPVENLLIKYFAGTMKVGSHSFSYTRGEYRQGTTIDGDFTAADDMTEEKIDFRLIEGTSQETPAEKTADNQNNQK